RCLRRPPPPAPYPPSLHDALPISLTGKPPTFFDSGMPVFCRSGRLPTPAPMNTNFEVWYSCFPFFKFLTLTCHSPLSVLRISLTLGSKRIETPFSSSSTSICLRVGLL